MTNRKKLLIVDDDPADLAIAARTLRATKPVRYDLVQAGSVEEAASTLRVSLIDLIILDLNLEETRGVDTVVALRKSAGSVPIVVLTGEDSQDTGLACIDAGAEDFLEKQEMSQLLMRAVEFTLRRNGKNLHRSGAALRSILLEGAPEMSDATAAADLADQLLLVNDVLTGPAANLPASVRKLAVSLVKDASPPMPLFRKILEQETSSGPPPSLRVGLLAVHIAQAYHERFSLGTTEASS